MTAYKIMEKELFEYAQYLLLPKKDIKLPVVPLLEENQTTPLLYNLFNNAFTSRVSKDQLILPNFKDCNTVSIFTDYGGESKDSKFLTYTITLVGYDHLGHFDKAMLGLRQKYKLNAPNKEIAFKDLRYGPIARALDEYLLAVNNFVNGLVFTLVVDKNVFSLAERNEKISKEEVARILEETGFGKFKIDVAEKIYRIININSYLVRLLVPNNKNLFWMSDHDSTIATKENHNNIADLFSRSVHSFENAKYGTIGYATPFSKTDNNLFLDLLSISDLTAGAIEHYLTRQKKLQGSDFTISDGANKIIMWLANNGLAFKKLTYIVSYDEKQGAYNGGFLDFTLKEPLGNATFVDVTL